MTNRAVLELCVERPVVGGAMLAHHEGRVVLVAGAVPGERVRVRVDRERRDVIHATVVDVLSPDADRRDVSVDSACGGQVYRHIAYRRQLALKSEVIGDALTRIGKRPDIGPVSVAASVEHGYRMRARLHCGPSTIGFLREGTHTVCDAAPTGQLLDETANVVAALGRRLRDARLEAVERVELAESLAGDQRVLHLQLRRPVSVDLLAACTTDARCTGVTSASSSDRAPTVLHGSPTVSDSVTHLIEGGRSGSVTRHASSFFQANRYLLPDLVAAVCRRVPEEPVLDLYAGVGLFGVALSSCGVDEITAVELDRLALADLKLNGANCRHPIDVVRASTESYLAGRSVPIHGTVIVDPPRTGLARPVVERLALLRAARVVYVSCDVATFARDVRRLSDAGYQIGEVEAFDMFPNTAHVELVATLSRGPTPRVTSAAARHIP